LKVIERRAFGSLRRTGSVVAGSTFSAVFSSFFEDASGCATLQLSR
jgi:hypothetical protein